MTGTTYFCTDRYGNVYCRFSVAHVTPRYTHAAVARRPGTTEPVRKPCVNYASGRANAEAVVRGWNRAPNWEGEVVEVRAYEGRHKVEPGTDNQRLADALNRSIGRKMFVGG